MLPPYAELVGLDFVAFNDGNRVAGGLGAGRPAEKVGNIENDECEADEHQAPVEPVAVPAHPVEHCHERALTRTRTAWPWKH
jgi:hypothetical protein